MLWKVFLIFLFLFVPLERSFTSELVAQRLINKKSCFVKRYEDKRFSDVSSKRFQKLKIFSKEHKKNNKFSVFKFENKIYVTPTKCLIPIQEDPESLDEDEEDLFDSEEIENNKRLNQAASSNDLIKNLASTKNNYFIELGPGVVNITDDSLIFPYDQLSGEYKGDNWNFSSVGKSKYKNSTALNFEFGWKINPGSFFTLKVKHFKGAKDELINVQKNSGAPVEVKSQFEDSFLTFLVGTKFVFFPDSFLRPVFSIYAGLNSISSTQTFSAQGREFDLSYTATSLTGIGELGFEIMFSDNFGLHLKGGYQYLGKQNFRLKESTGDSSSEEGFQSGLNYSNTFANAGVQFYFE